jgi:hypothetical protein
MAKKIKPQLTFNANLRKNKKHFVLYNNGGVISATTPKDWARANRNLFQNYNFLSSKTTPTVNLIEKMLSKNNFLKLQNSDIVIMYNYISL